MSHKSYTVGGPKKSLFDARKTTKNEFINVASATGAAEPLKYTRRKTQMQRTMVASTSNKEKGKGVVEEEDADELNQDEGEEEYNSSCNGSDEDIELEEDEEDY
ncbi:hypothetical protein CR513_06624, partial [Mucuna pruriens]